MSESRSTPPDREQVIETARKLFAHYGWSNPGDLEMRARIEKMRDMALASIASETTERLTPEELQRLIDYHDNASAGAEAQDYFDAAHYHAKRCAHFTALRDRIADGEKATLERMTGGSDVRR